MSCLWDVPTGNERNVVRLLAVFVLFTLDQPVLAQSELDQGQSSSIVSPNKKKTFNKKPTKMWGHAKRHATLI